MFYIFINTKTNYFYCNYSNRPQRSVEAHIRRANNPTSRDYYKPFHTALREHLEDFDISYQLTRPSFAYYLHHYSPLKEDIK